MSDLIDRQILKADLLCGDNAEHDYCFPCKEILERIDNQPSAEMHDKRTETHACDCVSRQAAIDAILEQTVCATKRELVERCDANISDENGWLGGVCIALDTIEDLPSAQPAEAIPVAFLEEQAKWFESMDNAFAKIEANNIRVMIKKYRSEKDERSD